MTQLHKIVSNHDKNDKCCEYLEVAVKMNSGQYHSLIMERVNSTEYQGYAQWFRESFRKKVDEKPDIRNSFDQKMETQFPKLKTAKVLKLTMIIFNLFVSIIEILFVKK